MNKNQLATLRAVTPHAPRVELDQLDFEPGPRTLICGYDMYDNEASGRKMRFNVHIYFNGCEFVTLRSRPGMSDDESTVVRTASIRQEHLPSKFAYPSRCDYKFASSIRRAGLSVNFTYLEDDRGDADFQGRLHGDDDEILWGWLRPAAQACHDMLEAAYPQSVDDEVIASWAEAEGVSVSLLSSLVSIVHVGQPLPTLKEVKAAIMP